MAESQELEIVLKAKDEATKALQTFTSKVKDAGEKVGGMTKQTDKSSLSFGKLTSAFALGNIATAALSKATSFLTGAVKDSIAAAREAEVSMAKVNAIQKTLKISTEASTKAIEEASDAAMKLGFDDEMAAESMAKLLQVTNDTKTAQEAFQAAMDISRFSGVSLEDATKKLNLAMQGNGKILKELNIDVPDNANAMTVLGLVHDKVRGQAEAYGKTAAGAQEKLAVSIENVKEKFGVALNEGLQPFITKLTDWISKPETQKFLSELAKTLGQILTKLLDLANSALPRVIEFVDDFRVGWDNLTDSLAKVLIAIDKVKKAMPNFKSESPQDWFGRLFSGREHGGPITAGHPYIVGERGPEVIVPDVGSRVIPNAGGGSVSISFGNVSVRNESDIDSIVSKIQSVLGRRSELASKGVI